MITNAMPTFEPELRIGCVAVFRSGLALIEALASPYASDGRSLVARLANRVPDQSPSLSALVRAGAAQSSSPDHRHP
jgi:hypothetical protein